jgi:aminomethyltransferase
MAIVEGGEVTSGTQSPSLDEGIGLAYVTAALAEPGTEVTVDLRGRPRKARIVPKPFIKGRES